MEASALHHARPAALHGRSPLLRLQSDDRLVALTRRGNQHAFEALVSRYQTRLLAFCRHMLASREDAEDVLQEVFAAAFNAMLADEREINVRPWLYRIARNRSLNHLRRHTAIGVDSMDVHLSEGGLTTADKVHKREEFRQLIADVQELPETQRTALLLREIDALSYEQIAEAMETTVPSVKSLLVRARVSLAEASEARLLSCEEVRVELGEVAEGLRRSSAPVRRHVRSCERCTAFRTHLRQTNKQLAMLLPVAPLLLAKKLLFANLGTTAAAGGGTAAAAGGGAVAGTAAGSAISAGVSAFAGKAAAGFAAAALVTASAVEVQHAARHTSGSERAAAAATASGRVQASSAATPAATATALAAVAPVPTSAPVLAANVREGDGKIDIAPKAKPSSTPAASPTPVTPAAATGPGGPVTQVAGDTTTLPTTTEGAAVPVGVAPTPGITAPGQGTTVPGQTAAQGTPVPTVIATPAASPASAATPAPSPTAAPAPSATPSPTPVATPSPAPTVTPAPSATPSPSATAAADATP